MKKHTMNPVDEKIIIKKLKAGDNEAYKYLYDYHYVAPVSYTHLVYCMVYSFAVVPFQTKEY